MIPQPPIFVVDDDFDIRSLMTEILCMEGHEVVALANGREALDLLLGGTRPRLILLDLMMPGMNGWQFRAAQMRHPELALIPVVVLTGDGSVQPSWEVAGVSGYLRKPIDLDQLLQTVKRY